MTESDVIVVGLGAMGSAAVCQLALRGVTVTGLDQFTPPHSYGSSHGDTRISRVAVGEGPEYVPLVRRSHELWRELESVTGRDLLVQCGGLVLGVPNSTGRHGVDNFVDATRSVAKSNEILIEELSTSDIAQRFDVFKVTNESGTFEPSAGFLRAPACIAAQIDVAQRNGASIHTDEAMLSWTSNDTSVRVVTDRDVYVARHLVLALGPWMADQVRELRPRISVYRQVQFWFDAGDAASAFGEIPVFIWMHGSEAHQYFYGFPSLDGRTVKVATEQFSTPTTPLTVDRAVSGSEIREMFSVHVRDHLQSLGPQCLQAAVCLYTATKDFGFLIDRHPRHENVFVASPCSGHGFKHSAAIGEAIAQSVLGEPTTCSLQNFSLDRLKAKR